MKTLPCNISAHPDGLLVRVVRKGVTYQALVPTGFGPGALAEAMRLRDRFLVIHGAIAPKGPHRVAYSNTGHVGISETVHWRRSRPKNCFLVSCRRDFRRRIYYGPQRTRECAWQMAVALRARELAKGAV